MVQAVKPRVKHKEDFDSRGFAQEKGTVDAAYRKEAANR
jgi:hypothetical protein